MIDSVARTLGQYEIPEEIGCGGVAKVPMERYPTASDLIADLLAHAESRPAPAVHLPLAARPTPRPKILGRVWIGRAVMGVALLVGVSACARMPGGSGTVPEEEHEVPTVEPVAEEPTETPTEEPEPTETPLPIGFAPVTRNADWEPVIQDFNGVEMALVPAGCFMMGNEQPVHEVCFEEPFWIDVYEVTNGQFGSAASDCTHWSSSDNQPRICVDWRDATAHCESRGARLPTEAEWEYAARGPDGLVYPWGNEFIADNVVYGDNSGGHTASVGSRPGDVSWVGAYDMSGNAWEWVADWYGTYPSEAQVNPTGPGSGQYRVLRGGSWGDHSSYSLRGANRLRHPPVDPAPDHGFRCALSQ
jgi:formylglycine-generating enzyme required for sulfatase activity